MELCWQPSFDVGAMHAAWAVASGRRLLEAALHDELEPAAKQLEELARSWRLTPTVFWRQLLMLSADEPSNQSLAERLLKRLLGSNPPAKSASQLAAAIAACESIVRQRFPRMLDELAVRVGPLQLAWEARGPGLLTALGRITEQEFLVESATVILVQPVVGGDGMAHLLTNRVHMEALLTDVDPRLPETLRLAWLLGQLNLDRPKYSEQVHGHALAQVAELALLPAILASAEAVQLTQLEPTTLKLALSQWTRTPDEQLERQSRVIMAWWETASAAQWPWNTALTGLSKML